MPFVNSLHQKIITSTLFGGAGSMLIGLLFFQQKIFWYHHSAFQFIMYGFSFAFLYLMIKYTNNYKFIISVIMVFLLNVLIAKSFQLTSILRDMVVIFILSIAVFAINILIKHFGRNISFYRILIWTIIFSIGYAIAGFFLILINKHEIIIGAMLLYVKLGLLIGLGISIGLELKELLLKRSSK